MLHVLPQLCTTFKYTCTFPVLCALRTSGRQWGQDNSHPVVEGSSQNVSGMPTQAHTLAVLGTKQGSMLKHVVLFFQYYATLSLSTKTHTCIFSLSLSWLDKIKAMSIKFPFIPAKTLKMIWKQELPISHKKKDILYNSVYSLWLFNKSLRKKILFT